jgi:type I restriction enzyme S subunit
MSFGKQKFPAGWDSSTIGDWCENLDSKRIPINSGERKARLSGKSDSELYPYYGATGQVGRIDGYLFDGKYVLIGEDGAPFLDPFRAKAYIVSGRFWVNNHAHILEPKAHPRFVCHYLNQFRYADHVTGTTRLKLTKAALQNIPIPIAPLNEQDRIVAKIEELFSELDKGLEYLKQARAQLAVYRQALLKHAFEGKLTTDWRATHTTQLESADQLLARLRTERETLYQQQLAEWSSVIEVWEAAGKKGPKPSKPREPKKLRALGDDVRERLAALPPSWAWDALGWMTSGVEYGSAAKSSKAGTHVVLRMGNLQNGKLDWSDLAFSSDAAEVVQYLLRPGDVLFNRTNSPEWVGKTAIYRGERPALFAGYLIRINHSPKVVRSEYLNWFLNSPVAKQYGNTVKTDGVNQSNINGDKLVNYPFAYCSLAEQGEIVRILEETVSLIDRSEQDIEANLQKAEALRQSILKKAFAGELVPQDPADEPAALLLTRIRAERAAAATASTKPKLARARDRKRPVSA